MDALLVDRDGLGKRVDITDDDLFDAGCEIVGQTAIKGWGIDGPAEIYKPESGAYEILIPILQPEQC